MVSSGTLPERVERKTGTTAPLFELSYNRKEMICGEVNRRLVEFRPSYASLGFLEQASGHSEYASGDEVRFYSIWVGPKAFDGFCQAVCGENSAGFDSFQKGAYHCCAFRSDLREERILSSLDRSFDPGTDKMNHLLLESQILELLSLNIERLLGNKQPDERLSRLSRTDAERLILAREILLNRLESPPSLLELSRMIQMNDCKLKRSFKHYFGKTVYEFVREQRLEKAFSLLQSGSHNVGQSAFAVGYTNASHFSQAFRERFGFGPRALTRNGG
jgi:AraC-like DNA-binding protein